MKMKRKSTTKSENVKLNINSTFKREDFSADLLESLDDVKNYKNFLEYLKSQILDESEYQEVTNKKGEIVNFFLKKSGYYKLKRAFGITIELIDWKYHVNDHGRLSWVWFHVRGFNGKEHLDAFGACDKSESGKSSSNDVFGTAHTRAMLRAISQLVDFGSVGAEEISKVNSTDKERVKE
ncbi:MAG: cell division protein ZapC [Methanobacterium paludis]|nr:cell division protein ZapC [Methanobacterium paludis]